MADPAQTPAPPGRRGRSAALMIIGALVLFFGGCGIGYSVAGTGSSTAASSPVSTETVTVRATGPTAAPAPAETVTVSGPETTVTAAGPETTVTVPGPETTVTATAAGSAQGGGTGTAANEIADGTYEVPTDVVPGRYRTQGTATKGIPCYFARLKGTSGELGDILANGNPSGPTTVTIKKTDKAFETDRCLPWKKIG